MHDEQDRWRVEQDRADRQVIEQAAAQLRTGAIQAGYAGLEHKHLRQAAGHPAGRWPAMTAARCQVCAAAGSR